MSAPYSSFNLRFCPTGGVNVDNMKEYLSIPSVFAVGGSWLATAEHIKNNDWQAVTNNAKQALA